nr:tRNA (adenine-N1)-methyltransferase [Methanobacterium alcaliphilum]
MDDRGKKYILDEGQDFHNDLGIIKKEELENCVPGDILKTHKEHEVKVIQANVNDFIELMERKCSILLPKDIGIVIAYTGLGCGDKVVDAGTGAGAIALHFANVVGKEGEVHSYEIREDFTKIAQKNVKQFGFDNITIKNQDIKEGIDEEEVDLIFLDLPKPYEMMESVFDALKSGGWLAVYAPYIEQVQILNRIAKKIGFNEINTIECILREMEVKSKGTRPKTRMVGHTGYLSFARKL